MIPGISQVDAAPRQSLAEQRGAIQKRGYANMQQSRPVEILANRLTTAVQQGGARRLVGRSPRMTY
jgi:hypothetical protein